MTDGTTPQDKAPVRLDHWLEDLAVRALIWGLLRLPYRLRVPLCGWIMARLIAPVAGYSARVRENLALILPDLPEAEVRRMMRAVPDNVGRTLIEMYSGPEFAARAAAAEPHGPGLAALAEAQAQGRPVIIVTGHFGNYNASRAALIARGYRISGLYRPMKNRYFNDHYVQTMKGFGAPMFPRGRAGLADMVRWLRGGGILGILIDQHMKRGAPLTFFGHEAQTALSAAELALKYDALVLPSYAVRQPNGLDFDVVVEAPIPHSTPEEMTQALNDSLEAQVRKHPDQWFWIHRRWKPRSSGH